MAQVKAMYEELKEFNELAAKIIKKQNGHIGYVDVSKIKCFAVNNKERPESKRMWEVQVVKTPISLDFSEIAYYVTVYLSDWAEFSDKQKQYLVMDVLHSIPADVEEKVNTFDLKGFRTMIVTHGVDFMENADNLPDLVTEDVTWKQ